ncbi:MAG: hypothetical protein DI570_16445 [Phenylobacterium zucineum]|nr:MAG: hypothetical protein DI570_16445 [Phenylobacterium zucineum]
MKVWKPTDAEILAAVHCPRGVSGRTHHIAARLGNPLASSQTYRRLIRLERAGLVERDLEYSFANSIYWRLPSKAA